MDETLDRLRCVIFGIPGVVGYALALQFDDRIEVSLNGQLRADAAAQGIVDVARDYRTQPQIRTF